MATLMTIVERGNASQKIADLLSSATLVVLSKKDAVTMDEMKTEQGASYLLP
jgi:hypothetical protein